MSTVTERQEMIHKLREMIKDLRVAMLTTVAADGRLHSRPMIATRREFDGELWFFSHLGDAKVRELKQHPEVNVSYASQTNQRYLSISGRAEVVDDPTKVEFLWDPLYRQWFPEGLDDPDLGLLRVAIEEAEYWDTASGTMSQAGGFFRAIITGSESYSSEHERLEFPRHPAEHAEE